MLVLRRTGQSNRRRFPLAAVLTVPAGDQTIAPSGIASAEAFGTATVTAPVAGQTVTPTGIASAAAFGTAALLPGAVSIQPSGIASGFATGLTELLMAACTAGVLQVDGTNARYVRNTAGIVYLAGFHTWYNVQDGGPTDPPPAFDWAEYLAALVSYGCNFTKIWASLETAQLWADPFGSVLNPQYFSPSRYERTGPGNAADGKLKFDLTQINADFRSRLRARVIEAGNAGIYCTVQLFQGWQIDTKSGSDNPWTYHPYRLENNINGVDGDNDNDGQGTETHTDAGNNVLAYQEAMVEAIIDTLNDLDNVFWEISNEDTGSTNNTDWQEYLINHIATYEAGKPKQHLIGRTVCWPNGDNAALDASAASWVSYNGDKANAVHSASDPVSFRDSDHVEGIATDYPGLIFEPFCNGHGGSWYMDPWDGGVYGTDTLSDATYNRIRRLTGDVRSYAERMDLANAAPQAGLSTTNYCIAKTTGVAQILVYQPGSGAFNVTLTSISGTFSLEWFRISDGTTQAGSDVTGGAVRTLTPPWSGAAVAYLELAELTIAPSGIASGAAFGTATIVPGAITISCTGIASAEAFGSAAAQPGTVTVTPSGIASTEAFGAASLAAGAVTIVATGIATAAAFGTALLQAGASYIAPTGIASAEAHGDATVQSGTVSILPAGIASSETHGETLLATGAVLQPTGIASGEAHGSTVVQPGAVSILASGIASAEALGTAALLVDLLVAAAGIATGEAFGTALLSVGGAFVQPAGIASGETFGGLAVLPGAVSILPAGIAGGEAFGTLRLVVAGADQYIDVPSVQDGETFGIATLLMALIAERTFSVRAETRRYVVAAENRTYSVTR